MLVVREHVVDLLLVLDRHREPDDGQDEPSDGEHPQPRGDAAADVLDVGFEVVDGPEDVVARGHYIPSVMSIASSVNASLGSLKD